MFEFIGTFDECKNRLDCLKKAGYKLGVNLFWGPYKIKRRLQFTEAGDPLHIVWVK